MTAREVIGWIAVVIVLDGLAALIGGLVSDSILRRWRWVMFGFAAGALVATGAFELLPEASARLGWNAILWAMAGAAILLVFERLVGRHEHDPSPVSPIALLGADGVHNFCDGMTIAAAFTMSPRVGVVTSIAVILHELPQELADYALLRSAGMSRRGALLNLALVQLTAGLGAATTLLASQWSAGIEGIVLSLAAGMFLYIGAHDLLPEVVRAKQRGAWVAFAVGGALGLLG